MRLNAAVRSVLAAAADSVIPYALQSSFASVDGLRASHQRDSNQSEAGNQATVLAPFGIARASLGRLGAPALSGSSATAPELLRADLQSPICNPRNTEAERHAIAGDHLNSKKVCTPNLNRSLR